MNLKEKQLIIDNDFDILWKNLWVDLNNINNRIKREYERSKIHFNTLKKERKNRSPIFLLIVISTQYIENEWEIPKGRRNNREKIKLVQYVNLKKKQIFQKININSLIMLYL